MMNEKKSIINVIEEEKQKTRCFATLVKLINKRDVELNRDNLTDFLITNKIKLNWCNADNHLSIIERLKKSKNKGAGKVSVERYLTRVFGFCRSEIVDASINYDFSYIEKSMEQKQAELFFEIVRFGKTSGIGLYD